MNRLLLAAIALATLGTSAAANAYPGERHDRVEIRHDRQELRHDRRDYRHDRRSEMRHHNVRGHGRYFWKGRYYQNRYRHNGGWRYR